MIELLEKLYSVRAKWYNLGLGLGISCDDLDAIKKDCKEDTGDCLREVLKIWLSKNPLKSDLIEALESKTVRGNRLAVELLTWSTSSSSFDDVHQQTSPSNFNSVPSVSNTETKVCFSIYIDSILLYGHTKLAEVLGGDSRRM